MPNYSRERRDKDVAAGKCPLCRKPNDDKTRVWCTQCRLNQREYNDVYRAAHPPDNTTFTISLKGGAIRQEQVVAAMNTLGWKVVWIRKLTGQAKNQFTKKKAAV